MHFSRASTAAALAATLRLAAAQTSTTCNPLDKTCPADPGLNTANFNTDFTAGKAASWSVAEGTTLSYGANGAEFTINSAGQAPTIQTDFFIFFGRVEVTMQAAPGTGIVSSIVLESDDLDEIDWEFLGGNTAQVETNFFGKGNTTVYDRAIYYSVATPQTEFHTYTLDWTSEQLQFMIDGAVVRTIPYSDPLALGGSNYPQTPMRVKLGNWAGGGPGEPSGTVQWAGGSTNFGDAPFTMYVKSVNIVNYNPAGSYVYGDNSGSWQSIQKEGAAAGGSSSASAAVPTSSISVAPVSASGAIVTKTKTGSAYHTNTASASALNPHGTGIGSGASSTPAATGASTPTGSPSSPSSVPGSASLHTASAVLSLFTVALGFFLS